MAYEGARYPHHCRFASLTGVICVIGWEWGTVVFPKLCARTDIFSSLRGFSCSRIAGYESKEVGKNIYFSRPDIQDLVPTIPPALIVPVTVDGSATTSNSPTSIRTTAQ